MDEGILFPQIGSSQAFIGDGIQTSTHANKHLNIQDSYDIVHPATIFQNHAGSASAATSATHHHQFHSQPAFKPSLQTLRATEK